MQYQAKTIRTYVQLLRKDIHTELQHLLQALAAQDRATIKSAAHSLKGLCGSLRDPLLADLARSLQQEAEQVSWAELTSAVHQLQRTCDAIVWDG